MRPALLSLVLLGMPLALGAQRFTLTPTVGVYVPLTDQRSGGSLGGLCPPDDPNCDRFPAYDVDPGLAFGLAMSWNAVGPLGVEAELAWAVAALHPIPSGAPEPAASQMSSAGTSSAALRLSFTDTLTPHVRVTLAGGLSLINVGSAGYAFPVADESVVGSSLAAMVRVALSHHVRGELGVEHRAYEVEFGGSGSRAERDLLVSAGITVGLR